VSDPAEIPPDLTGYPVVVQLPVCWGEMDSKGHVNNAAYLRYFESAHVEYFRRLDWFTFERETSVGPILASTQVRFRRPLTYPDTISVAARVPSLEDHGFTFAQVIFSHALSAIVADGQGNVVAYHYSRLEKVRLPEEIRRRIAVLEGRS
jgi:acyl-CoA thioester hydrolase